MSREGGYGAVLRNRSFLLVWAAQVLSQSAQNVLNYALVVEVERLTLSSANVGWVIVSFSLPALLLGPSAGVFVDQVSKRGVLLWTNVTRAALIAGFLFAPRELQAIYGVTFLNSAISQFFAPAEGAIIPLLVSRREIMTATSLFNITFTVAQMAGFVLIGPTVFKLAGPAAAFASVIVMYALAALCVAFVRRAEATRGDFQRAFARAINVRSVWRDMLETRQFLRFAPGVTAAIGHLALATTLLMTLATLGPGFVNRVLGLGPEDAGYILAPAGLGMLLTTAYLGQFAVHADRYKVANRGLVAMGLSLAALALIRPVFEMFEQELTRRGPGALPIGETIAYIAVVALITLALGVEFSFVTIPAQTVVAEATEPHIRGRVFAVLFMITGTVSALPVLAIGALADTIGIVPMLLILAVLVALAGTAGLAGWRLEPIAPGASRTVRGTGGEERRTKNEERRRGS